MSPYQALVSSVIVQTVGLLTLAFAVVFATNKLFHVANQPINAHWTGDSSTACKDAWITVQGLDKAEWPPKSWCRELKEVPFWDTLTQIIQDSELQWFPIRTALHTSPSDAMLLIFK